MNPCVYIHIGDDEKVLYVGMTCYFQERISQHSCSSHWFTQIRNIRIVHCETKDDALGMEAYLIGTLSPLYTKPSRRRPKRLFLEIKPNVLCNFMREATF